LDLQAMLIRAGAKNCLLSLQLLPSFEHVRKDRSVEMSDVGCYNSVSLYVAISEYPR
jgi:hypothetical protein